MLIIASTTDVQTVVMNGDSSAQVIWWRRPYVFLVQLVLHYKVIVSLMVGLIIDVDTGSTEAW